MPSLVAAATAMGPQSEDTRLEGMSAEDFARISAYIHRELGIRMPPSKKPLLEARLKKRFRKLEMKSYSDYCEHLFSPEGLRDELVNMVDAVTTNKTDFFREPGHFEYLERIVVPELIRFFGLPRRFRVWSAGCSSGEEPYTLAMVLEETAGRCSEFRYSILATDICTTVLDQAQAGVYDHERVEPVTLSLRKKYLRRGKDEWRDRIRVTPQLREKVTFRRLNLMDEEFGLREKVDVIFCRNVVIYFDKSTQAKVFQKLCRNLNSGGYLFIGHSESLFGMDLPLTPVVPTVFRRV